MSSPRIILLDLETLPDLSQALLVWPGLSNFPGTTFKASLNSICCFGWKELWSERPAEVICAWDFPSWQTNVNDDSAVLTAALKILEGADGIITQNGKSFDEKFLRTRLLLKDMPDIAKMKHSDTKHLAKKFSFYSNSLKYLAEQLTDKKKLDNEGWALWVKVYGRDPIAQETMRTYCAGDVEALEAIYRKLRRAAGGANALPNHNLFDVGQGREPVCPECGSTRLMKNGNRYTPTGQFQRYSCKDCGAHSLTDKKDKNPRAI